MSLQKKSRRILVVEDSRTQAEYLRHILEADGYRVILAESGTEALELITTDHPAMVLTDVVMPEMDGYELCRVIKKDPSTARIPVVLVTQLFDPVDVIRGVSAGADDFIIKPFEPAYIRTRINAILSRGDQPGPEGSLSPLEVRFGDSVHQVMADRRQILNILLSTYEVAVSRNSELQEAQERLNTLNDKLQEAVDGLQVSNSELEKENAERRRVEKALDEANRKLNLMASITRHDVLNQLAAQHEYLESALAQKGQDADAAWSQVARARDLGTQTINAIRFTGEYQKIGIKAPVWHDLFGLISEAIRTTPAAGVKVENKVPQGISVHADPLIGKIFSNIIENSAEYTGTGSELSFSFIENEGSGIIVCEDNGPGVDPEKKEKIFQYEYGINTSMGLFLSREILSLTGLSMKETGTFGKGARFEIYCPAGTFRHAP